MATLKYFTLGKVNPNICVQANSYMKDNPDCNNTVVLLRLYRNLTMDIALNVGNLSDYLENSIGIDVNKLLDTLENCGVNLSNNNAVRQIGNDIKEKNDIYNCINKYYYILCENDPNGNLIKSVLFHTYFSKISYRSEDVRIKISHDLELTEVLCDRTYLRYRKYCIEKIDACLWSDTNPYKNLLEKYVMENACKLSLKKVIGQ